MNNNIILVGHLYGYLYAQEYATSFSSQISGLVLLGPIHELFLTKLKKLNNDCSENNDKKLNAIDVSQGL